MKKFLILGLMFAMFAPTDVFASCTALGTGGYYSTIPGATCTEDGSGFVTESVPPSSTGEESFIPYDTTPSYDLSSDSSSSYVPPSGSDTYYPSSSNSSYSGNNIYSGSAGISSPSSGGLSGGVEDVSHLVSFLIAALRMATTLILGAAVVFFLWGVFKFVKNADNEEAREEGKNQIIYGIIGIAVMVSLWGLVRFLTQSAGLTTEPFAVPSLPLPPGQ